MISRPNWLLFILHFRFAGLAMPLALNLTTNGQDITSLPDTVVGEIKLAAGSIVLPANMLKSTQLKPIDLGGISANISLNIPQKKLVVKQGVFDLGDSSLLKVEAEITKQAQNFTVVTNAVFEDFDIQRLDQFLPPSLQMSKNGSNKICPMMLPWPKLKRKRRRSSRVYSRDFKYSP